jgi:hypothetical protein
LSSSSNRPASTVTFDPSGSSGWHSHPGVVLVTVASGSVVAYDEHCVGTPHTAGTASSAFTESGDEPALVRNESTTTTEVSNVTYIVPAGTKMVYGNEVPATTSITLPDNVKNWVGAFLPAQVRDTYEEISQKKPHGDLPH